MALTELSVTDGAVTMPQDIKDVTIHWFRHGLRLHDNPALLDGLTNCATLYPVFIMDGKVAGTSTSGYNRWRFLLESLTDLHNSFRKHGGQLHVYQGDPVEIFRKLFSEWGVTKVTCEIDPEPIWRERDELVKTLCVQRHVKFVEKVSHTLWDPKEICEKNGGMPPVTYMLFNQVARAIGEPSRPVADPDFSGVELPLGNNNSKVPTLQSLGIKAECPEQNRRVNEWKGGEAMALTLIEKRLQIEKKAFEHEQVLPNQVSVDLTGPPMSMSAHLRFGCLSIRRLYWRIMDTYTQVKGEEAPLSATAQLMWREYFYTMSYNNIKYNTVKGNPICLNIPWDDDKEKVAKWLNGETGFPWIDAIMKQLHHEGWIHQVARHAVACFLTRGDLWQSWEEGLRVFDKYLLDADWSVCAGNWMWVASSAFEDVLQCPRCFCPVRYGVRMDPTGAYIRRYLPVLKDMPLKFLFSPWKAPLSVQEKAKCIVGKDYPKPMVDHYTASKKNKKYMNDVKAIHCKEKDIGMCGPTNQLEVGQLAFLPEYEDPNIRCLSDQTCQALRITGED